MARSQLSTRRVLSRMTFGLAMGALAGLAGPAGAATFSDGDEVAGPITINGDMSDWNSNMTAATDPNEAYAADDGSRDLTGIFLANDGDTLYGRHTVVGNIRTNAPTNGRRMYYVMDLDNDAATGSDWDGKNKADLDGVEAVLRMRLGDSTSPAESVMVADGSGGFTEAASSIDNASDGSTGMEWQAPFSDAGITGETTIRWFSYQTWHGDYAPGGNWNNNPQPATYDLVVPEPSTAALLICGGGAVLLRRRRRDRPGT